MGIAFAIIAHDDPAQLRRLLAELKGFQTVIHLDASTNIENYLKFISPLDPAHSFTEQRVVVRWGGYSVVKAMLLAGSEVSERIENEDHIIFLSGHCFPIKPLSELQDYVENCTWRQHIRAFSAASATKFSIERWRQRHWFDFEFWPIKSALLFRLTRRILFALSYPFKVNSEIGELTAIGSQWIALTKDCFDEIARDLNSKKFSYLKNAFAPDEMVFHTAVYSSKWRNQTKYGAFEENPEAIISKVANLHVLDLGLKGEFTETEFIDIPKDRFFTRKISSENLQKFLDYISQNKREYGSK
jgi:hypothetical protein